MTPSLDQGTCKQSLKEIQILINNQNWNRALSVVRKLSIRFPHSEAVALWFNSILVNMGELDAAADCLHTRKEQVELSPHLFSQYLFSLHGSSQASSEDILAAHRQYADQHSPRLTGLPTLPTQLNKVGLISGEMCNHASSSFLLPLIKGLNASGIETTLFSTALNEEDAISERIKKAGHHWHRLKNTPTDQAAALITETKPDILLNCDWHLPHNRMDISHTVGHHIPQIDYLQADATGIPQIPFHLADKHLAPESQTDDWLAKKNLRLEGGAHIFEPWEEATEQEPANYRDWQGSLLIGSSNHICKINDSVIECWSEILKTCSHVKLLLKSIRLDQAEIAKRTIKRFQKFGIHADRLVLLGFSPNRELNYKIYNKLSIALDPFPYNGVTTTCEALWMGVPVITLNGNRPIARKGASLLHQVGTPELIANNREDYISKAISLIENEEQRIHYHHSLRNKMKQSTLCNPTRMVEGLLKTVVTT